MERANNRPKSLSVQDSADIAGLFNKVFDAIVSAQKAGERGDRQLVTKRQADIHHYNLMAMKIIYPTLPEKEAGTCLRTINNLRGQILDLERGL